MTSEPTKKLSRYRRRDGVLALWRAAGSARQDAAARRAIRRRAMKQARSGAWLSVWLLIVSMCSGGLSGCEKVGGNALAATQASDIHPTTRFVLSQTPAANGSSTPAVAFQGDAPYVTYTDALSGPVNGGEGNQGAYLSIFGRNFGSTAGMGVTSRVFIGGFEVANYRYLGPAKVGARLGLQQLTVQVGNLGNPALGVPLPVTVVVNGKPSNADNTFIPNPGFMLFVSLSGNDVSAVAGDVSKPWRYLQTVSRAGVYSSLRAGDHIIIRGGDWSDTGFETAWLRFRDRAQMGSLPTGAAGTGWIHITAYPGPIKGNAIEDVHYSTPRGAKGGIHGPGSAYYGTTGEYVSVSNLRMDISASAASDAAPINLQSSGGNWRVVNNELGPWPSEINSKAAGVSGHGNLVKVLGNHIFGMACTGALENHGIYADSGATEWEIGYNWIHDITGGNLIQFFDNVGLAGNNYGGLPANWTGFTGMQIHHNWLDGAGKYGLNMADGVVSGVIWNNVVTRATFSGLRINTASKNLDLTIAFNTFYDNDLAPSGSGNAQVLNTWGNYEPTGQVRIYNNIFAAGPGTIRTSNYYLNRGSSDAYVDFRHNLYWDRGYGWSSPTKDPTGVVRNPKFDSAATGDLAPTSGSAALGRGTQSTGSLRVVDDLMGRSVLSKDGARDVGAIGQRR